MSIPHVLYIAVCVAQQQGSNGQQTKNDYVASTESTQFILCQLKHYYESCDIISPCVRANIHANAYHAYHGIMSCRQPKM